MSRPTPRSRRDHPEISAISSADLDDIQLRSRAYLGEISAQISGTSRAYLGHISALSAQLLLGVALCHSRLDLGHISGISRRDLGFICAAPPRRCSVPLAAWRRRRRARLFREVDACGCAPCARVAGLCMYMHTHANRRMGWVLEGRVARSVLGGATQGSVSLKQGGVIETR